MSDFNQQTSQLIIIPGSPAIIPGLGFGDAPSYELAQIIGQQLEKAKHNSYADIVGSRCQQWHTQHTGSLRAWGQPSLNISMGNYLPELIAAYFLDAAGIEIAESRDRLEPVTPDHLTVVVIDGSAGLNAKAPLSLLPTADTLHQWCMELLSDPKKASRPLSAAELRDGGIIEPDLWLELSHLAPRVHQAQLLSSDTTLGVGRYIATWEIA